MANAIILAAGKSNRFAPFTYEKPKGLFKVRGEVLINRQIEQLQEAGIKDIYVVIGFMKEKFFYLEEKYGCKLVINNEFSNFGNIYSLYVARKYLEESYICCADHYFEFNPFLEKTQYSYRVCEYQDDNFREFKVSISDANVITKCEMGGSNSLCMVGHAFFNQNFSRKFVELMKQEIDNFGVPNLFWEEFYQRHITELTLYAKVFKSGGIFEFDDVESLIQYDQEFLANIDSSIISNICSVLKCKPDKIKKIQVIQKGLTNVSFKFEVQEIKYIYRHPGGNASNLVNRRAEIHAQNRARDLGIDKSVIYISTKGWKLSYYIQDLVECNLSENQVQLENVMKYLRKLHNCDQGDLHRIKRFDTFKEAQKLMKIASQTKGDLETEFRELTNKIKRLNLFIEKDNVTKVLCHNDVYSPNFLFTKSGDLFLIDWEYAGVNDPANDLACIFSRDNFEEEEIERYLKIYFGRELTDKEHRHFIAYIALSGYYWFCWGLYKGSVNDDDGFFFLPAYRNCQHFVDIALKSYLE